MPRQSTSDKILAKLPKGWAEKMLTEYSEGASDVEVQVSMKLHTNLWRELLTDEEFYKVVEFGRQLAKAFWYGLPRKHIFDKDFNSTLFKTYMANQYNWSDKNSVSETDKPFVESASDDQLLEKLSSKVSKIRTVK